MSNPDNDRDVLDIIIAVSKHLKWDMREQLRKLDEETARRVAQKYIEWICRVIDEEK